MGRLTLNALLSFANLSARSLASACVIRSPLRKKGHVNGWMPPLGYDVKDRKLVVNKNEIRTVVDIPSSRHDPEHDSRTP